MKRCRNIIVCFVLVLLPQSGVRAQSSLCSMYNGQKPSDPIYLNAFYTAHGSSAASCAQRMAIRLAPARDAADLVAQAAVEACSDEASKEAKALATANQSKEEVLQIVRNVMKAEALLAVITMRAGHCFPENSN